jgi:imidazole glycerol-phosphate synthase subunit HisF
MLTRRIIACLDVRDGAVVKGVQFEDLRTAGEPAALARRYYEEGADEIVILDVTATVEARIALARTVAAVAEQIFVPLAVGGGIRSMEDAAAVFDAGADKVSINTAALADPSLITRLANRYGNQAVVVAIDAKRSGSGFDVYARSGRARAHTDAIAWAREAADRGAGELLVTSMDRDGTRSGFDCELTRAMVDAVPIPVIASGGAGSAQDFVTVFERGRADAALAASILHFEHSSIPELKACLRACDIPVR